MEKTLNSQPHTLVTTVQEIHTYKLMQAAAYARETAV